MANMPGSGTLYFSQLRDVFGGGNPVWINQYYRGGGRVPDHQLNSGVPKSGIIWMSNFYNATSTQGVFANASPRRVDLYRSNNGTLQDSVSCTATGGTGSYSWSYAWIAGGNGIKLTATAGGFSVSSNGFGNISRSGDVRATVTSGPFTSYIDVNVFMQWGQPI